MIGQQRVSTGHTTPVRGDAPLRGVLLRAGVVVYGEIEMDYTFGPAKAAQIDAIMHIEQAGFTPEEAASRAAMTQRIAAYSDTFIVATTTAGTVAGYVVGPAFNQRYLIDELYGDSQPNRPADCYQTVLSLAVHPDFRDSGLGSALLEQLASVALQQGRRAITLTCLARLVPFYERNGFANEGIADSAHAGERWFNMVRELQ